ncbi:MAG TPA: response regulator [Thermoanaerobaculia bacterium]|nr:response regulator [Thermoanaerobaculia bacterium]
MTETAAAAAPLPVLIVDDEGPARALLRQHLAGIPGVRVVGECANGFEALRLAGELSPRIVFLDIEMPKLDGFEVLELLDPAIAVVFVTAYDSYAVKAFDVHAVDYVLKPFEASRLAAAVERALERLRRGQPVRAAELHAEARREGGSLSRVVVRDGSRVHIIPVEKLDAVEAQDDYVALKSEGRTYLKQQTLASLAAALDPSRFVRVHRSHLVRLDALARLEAFGKAGHVAILADGSRIPVSREGHARLRALLG